MTTVIKSCQLVFRYFGRVLWRRNTLFVCSYTFRECLKICLKLSRVSTSTTARHRLKQLVRHLLKPTTQGELEVERNGGGRDSLYCRHCSSGHCLIVVACVRLCLSEFGDRCSVGTCLCLSVSTPVCQSISVCVCLCVDRCSMRTC